MIIDTHADSPLRLLEGIDLGKESQEGHLDYIRMQKGQADAVFFALFTSNSMEANSSTLQAFRLLEAIYQSLEQHGDKVKLACSPEDILANKANGKNSILIGMENGSPVQANLSLLKIFHRLGVRYITLTHQQNNELCDSSTDKEKRWKGLSQEGKKMVYEMNQLGIMIDLSHASDDSCREILSLSTLPVIASHSCCRAICDIPRNMPNDIIKAIGQQGGVVQVCFSPAFLDISYWKKILPLRQIRDEYRQKCKYIPEIYTPLLENIYQQIRDVPPPSLEVIVDHIDHIVSVAGIDHVGLGSDFDGIQALPAGMKSIADIPRLISLLKKRGYPQEAIDKITGRNFMRVFQANNAQSHSITYKF